MCYHIDDVLFNLFTRTITYYVGIIIHENVLRPMDVINILRTECPNRDIYPDSRYSINCRYLSCAQFHQIDTCSDFV